MAKWTNLNPQSISDMTPKELRKTYSDLRSIARKRMDRLEAAGFETQRRFAPLSQLDQEDLEPELARLAYFLNSPGSFVKTARKEKEQISIVAKGYNIEDFNKFGDFMDVIRHRFKGRKLRDSDPFVVIYDEAEKRNISIKTLQREFGRYLNYEESAAVMKEALLKAPQFSKNQSYLSSKDLQKILDKRDIDVVYNKAVAAEEARRASEREKTKGKSRKKK